MNRVNVLTLLGVLVLMSLPASAQSTSATEQEILKAFRTLDEANITKDRATMERLMADDYLFAHSNGSVGTKAEDIAATMAPGGNWTGSKFSDLKVRIYGDVAVITGVQTLTGSVKGYVSGPRRITDLWVKRGGRWTTMRRID